MIKLIFTSAILVGSLFFFQSSLVQHSTVNKDKTISSEPIPISAIEQKEVSVQTKDGYVEITIRTGDKTQVIRQYFNCNT